MSIKKIHLNYIGTGKNGKMFSINVDGENQIYYGDTEPTTSMSDTQTNNKYNMYNFTYGHVINNLYRIDRVGHKSAVMRYNRSSALDNISDYIELYVPDESLQDVKGFTQNDDSIYTLNGSTGKDFKIPRYDFDKMCNVICSDTIRTDMYKPVSTKIMGKIPLQSLYVNNIISSGNMETSAYMSALYSVFTPYTNLSGIEYNYVMEIPQAYKYPYYDSGEILVNAFNTKNSLNYIYGNSLSVYETTTLDEDYDDIDVTNISLNGARRYFEINTCGDITYLKYYDDVQYMTTISGYLDDMVEESNGDYTTDIKMIKSTYGGNLQYQKIETIRSVNRFKYIQHKSNMYSITIHDDDIDKVNVSQETRDYIKKDIENNIRLITKKLCPANTELLKVYWK